MKSSQVVLITGASAGIGKELAIQYAKKKARLVLCARRLDALEELAQQLSTEVLIVQCDVRKMTDVQNAVDQTIQKFGRLDAVYANAGFGVFGPVLSLKPEDYTRQFETNIMGVVHTVNATLPELLKTKGKMGIVGSGYSYLTTPFVAPYSMSKYAVRALAETMQMELEGTGVSVTMICPGITESDFRQTDSQGVYQPERKDEAPKWIIQPTKVAVQKMIRAVESRHREIILTGHAKFGVFVQNHMPGVYSQLLRKFGTKWMKETSNAGKSALGGETN